MTRWYGDESPKYYCKCCENEPTKKYKGEYDETKGTSLSKKGKSTIRKERSSLFFGVLNLHWE